jgi:hypothetical protein
VSNQTTIFGGFTLRHPIHFALLAMYFLALPCFGQSSPKSTSLCKYQKDATEGSHTTVQVAGVFGEGLELGTLSNAACPEETTWVELALRDNKNKEKLRTILEDSHVNQASVVFEGEFYGPPPPAPKLPEAIRKSYHPNWGHLNCCRTKHVVHVIRDVKATPLN